jgi:hypothetical protein
MNGLDDNDAAFVAWAMKRHTWLWQKGFGPRRWKSQRARRIAQRSVFMLARIDRLLWVAFSPS